MKIDDFEKRFNEIVSNPDKGIASAPDFLNEVKGDYASAEALAAKVTELEGKVKDLQESNIKLYLATTSPVETEEEELDETDGEEYIDSVKWVSTLPDNNHTLHF